VPQSHWSWLPQQPAADQGAQPQSAIQQLAGVGETRNTIFGSSTP
jgi:hypothetical protein